MPVVGERLALRQPDLGPQVVAERFGCHHQRVQRCQGALVPVEARGVALQRPHHHLGPDRAPIGHHPARLDGGGGGLFDDGAAEALHRLPQAANQPCRIQRRRVSVEHASHHPGGVQVCPGLVGSEHVQVVFGESVFAAKVLDLPALAGQVSRVAGQADGPSLGEVAVDPLPFGDPPHLVDRIEHLAQQAAGGIVAGDPLVSIGTGGEFADAPPTVAPGGAEADDLLLYHQHSQRGVQSQQVVGGPQAGVSAADDGDVYLGVTRKRGAGVEGCRVLLQPQRSASVLVGHLMSRIRRRTCRVFRATPPACRRGGRFAGWPCG